MRWRGLARLQEARNSRVRVRRGCALTLITLVMDPLETGYYWSGREGLASRYQPDYNLSNAAGLSFPSPASSINLSSSGSYDT